MLTKEQVLERLLQPEPVSIVRCGDGEKIVLNSLSSVNALELCSQAVMHRQLGYHPSVNDIKEVRQNLIDAYTNADIIGIPNHKQKTDRHWGEVLAVLKHNAPDNKGAYCDIDVAYHLLDSGYDELLQGRKVLNYISCRNLDDGFKRKWGIEVVNKYTLQPEMKFTSGYEGDPHYPTQFNRVPRWMDVVAKDWPGSLLLVGAGVIGKVYCNWWRDRGGIAFDFGGVADIFAGKVTRGPGRGLDVDDTDTKYKL